MSGALLLTDAMLEACELPAILPPWNGPELEAAWPLRWRPLEHVHIDVPEDPWYQAHLEPVDDFDEATREWLASFNRGGSS